MNISRVLSKDPASLVDRTSILVVEDELLIRIMLSDSLRDAGYHVIEANSADEALSLLESFSPHLILSDVRMPGTLDGMGLLAMVKNSHPEIPVIIVSAHFESHVAIASGAADFVAKPYTCELVVKIVEKQLAKMT